MSNDEKKNKKITLHEYCAKYCKDRPTYLAIKRLLQKDYKNPKKGKNDKSIKKKFKFTDFESLITIEKEKIRTELAEANMNKSMEEKL